VVTHTRPPEDESVPMTAPFMDYVVAYDDWIVKQDVPVVRGFYIEDMKEVEVGPWARRGCNGAIVILEGTGGVNDTHVLEIPPGGSINPEKHMYEEMIYVLSGRGAASIWVDEKKKQTFEWGTGAVFSVPLNAWSEFHNGSGTEPARFMSVTNLPTVINMFHNEDFIYDNPFNFKDRFSGEDDFFSGGGKMWKNRIWQTNFVADAATTKLYSWKERGAGGSNIFFELAQNSMGAHISQFPVSTYKKAHHHGPGAHVILVDGEGYSLLWREEDEERIRCNWKPGSLLVPPEHWFHEHFNPGNRPARYLALRFTGRRFIQPGAYSGAEGADVSVKKGGWQIEYEDEDESIHREFEAELAKNGEVCRMKGMIPSCTGTTLDG